MGAGDTSESPEFVEMKVFGSPISKSKSYKFKLNQNNISELLTYYFHNSTKKDAQKTPKRLQLKSNDFLMIFMTSHAWRRGRRRSRESWGQWRICCRTCSHTLVWDVTALLGSTPNLACFGICCLIIVQLMAQWPKAMENDRKLMGESWDFCLSLCWHFLGHVNANFMELMCLKAP